MVTTLLCNQLYMEVEDDLMLFGCSTDEIGSEHILFTKPFLVDEQDIELGLDGVNVEYCEQPNSTYKKVEEIRIMKNCIHFKMISDAAKELRTEESIVIMMNDQKFDPVEVFGFLKSMFSNEFSPDGRKILFHDSPYEAY